MMKLFCPAKINLYLHILGKRPDGFHELETLMCPVSLYDELELEERAGGITLEVRGSDLPADATNLAYKAAQRVLEKSGSSRGIAIRLTKNIPMGGGLAGGSSNAASVIRGMNDLLALGLNEADLHEIAAGLGSDINFFLQQGPALCRGRGEQVQGVRIKSSLQVILINPGFGVPTPWAFQTYAKNPYHGVESSYGLDLADGTRIHLRNDLELAVFSKYVWLEEAKRWLSKQEQVSASLMSGSGATVFAILKGGLSSVDKENLNLQVRAYFGSDVWTQIVEVL